MLRIFLVQLLLFLSPFLCYALWLWLGKRSHHPERWSRGPIAWLTVAGLTLVIVGFVTMASLTKSDGGKDFRPSEMRDGVFIPGRYE